MKNELYKAIKSYCDENHCWLTHNTVKQWNGILETSYSPATFASLANDGYLARMKSDKVYSYSLMPTEELYKLVEEDHKQRDIENAKYRVEHYDEAVAHIKARYDRAIKQAEEDLKRDLEWEANKVAQAQDFLNNL